MTSSIRKNMTKTEQPIFSDVARIGWCETPSQGNHRWNRVGNPLPAADQNGWSCSRLKLSAVCLLGILSVGLLAGCSKEPQFRANQLEWVKMEKAARLPEGEHFDPIYHQDVADVMTAWFGTPDDPFYPMLEGEEDLANEVISLENLASSSGAVKSDREDRHAGLYREHCAHCHGITGDGAGPTASFLDPYPRDFRLGKFKFKMSPTGTPPSKEDLKRILVNGIPGTAMPSFRLLSDEELDSLTDYVIYLSSRGLTERLMIGGVRELGEDLPRMVTLPREKRISEILDPAGKTSAKAVAQSTEADEESDSEEAEDGEEAREDIEIPVPDKFDAELVNDELAYVYEDYFLPVLEKWLSALEYEADVPEVPEWIDQPEHELYDAKIELGQQLYFGQANCKQCHGETGLGDGQTNNYDDWTNDWLQVESLNPQDLESLDDYLKAGAFPPRPIKPRNLRTGVYRGGDRPEDVYLRIKNGIEGTPMPASLTLNEDQVWALVAYVRQLPYEPMSRPVTSKKATNDKAVR